MPTLDSITFDDATFESREDQNGARYWFTAQGDGCGLYLFESPPNIAAGLDSVEELRSFFRQMTNANGMGMIEVERVEVDGCSAVRTIVKSPQNPTGMTYIGSVTFPFRDFSYVLKVQCAEHGITGMRDAIILDQMISSGKVEWSGGQLVGMQQDAYDATIVSPIMRNVSDSEEYDAMFPQHPLSRVRAFFRQVLPTIQIADEVKTAAPFAYAVPKKSWWKKS